MANGGLKTDLSVLFDGNYGAAVPASHATRFVYSDTTTPYQGNATNSDVQWSLYANYSRLYRRTNNNDNPQAGLKATAAYQLKAITDATLKASRFEPNMLTVKQPILMPTVVRVDTVFSIVSRPAHGPWVNAAFPYLLHLMYLPVVTVHNPYNVRLRLTNMQVEFSDIPVGFEFLVNNQPTTTAGLLTVNDLYSANSGARKTFSMLLSNSLSSGTEVIIGAGQTRIFGTPFSADGTWGQEMAKDGNGRSFFDWRKHFRWCRTDRSGDDCWRNGRRRLRRRLPRSQENRAMAEGADRKEGRSRRSTFEGGR